MKDLINPSSIVKRFFILKAIAQMSRILSSGIHLQA
jgi:hypothetical protein